MGWFVSIDGVDDDYLAFLGYTLVTEDNEFKLCRDYRGEEYVVHKTRPFLRVDDWNDAQAIAKRSSSGSMIPTVPPRQ